MDNQCEKEVLISFAQHDQRSAYEICLAFERKGYTVVMQTWKSISEMHNTATRCQHVILVLSDWYINLAFNDSEWNKVFSRGPKDVLNRFLLAKVNRCYPEGLLTFIKTVDLYDFNKANTSAVVEAVEQDRATLRTDTATGGSPRRHEEGYARLIGLLCGMFKDVELRRFVRFLEDGEELSRHLPGPSISLNTLAEEVVFLLDRHGRIDKDLFVKLEQERPRRKHDIKQVRDALFDKAASTGTVSASHSDNATTSAPPFVNRKAKHSEPNTVKPSGANIDTPILEVLAEKLPIIKGFRTVLNEIFENRTRYGLLIASSASTVIMSAIVILAVLLPSYLGPWRNITVYVACILVMISYYGLGFNLLASAAPVNSVKIQWDRAVEDRNLALLFSRYSSECIKDGIEDLGKVLRNVSITPVGSIENKKGIGVISVIRVAAASVQCFFLYVFSISKADVPVWLWFLFIISLGILYDKICENDTQKKLTRMIEILREAYKNSKRKR